MSLRVWEEGALFRLTGIEFTTTISDKSILSPPSRLSTSKLIETISNNLVEDNVASVSFCFCPVACSFSTNH